MKIGLVWRAAIEGRSVGGATSAPLLVSELPQPAPSNPVLDAAPIRVAGGLDPSAIS